MPCSDNSTDDTVDRTTNDPLPRSIAGKGYLCYFDQGGDCTGPTSNTQGGITASMAGGSWLASLFSGFISDAFGRKKAIMLGAVIWVIGCIIVSASQDIPMLIVGRIINGFCVGICSAQVPVYISEIAPPSKRGRLVGAQQWGKWSSDHALIVATIKPMLTVLT